jgi:hypothetical protein
MLTAGFNIHKNKKGTRLKPGILIGKALNTAASVTKVASAFKATRIFPLHPNATPTISSQFVM